VIAIVAVIILVLSSSSSSPRQAPPATRPAATLPGATTSSLPTQKGASENGAVTNIPMAAGSATIEAKDPTSGATKPLALPPAVIGAGPQSGQQMGGMIFVLAGNRVWQLVVNGPNTNPPSTPPLRSPGAFVPPLGPGQVTLTGDGGKLFYLITPGTLAVSCQPAPGADQSVCTGAIGNAKG
ncbi:MAG: hypothetical protein M3N98_12310, partial [Actinomycetota bacterium]|nr:hypothetical protein [Actinomycetota bacterium]